jgi:hypothetical protein
VIQRKRTTAISKTIIVTERIHRTAYLPAVHLKNANSAVPTAAAAVGVAVAVARRGEGDAGEGEPAVAQLFDSP